jgi:hypothetical protein
VNTEVGERESQRARHAPLTGSCQHVRSDEEPFRTHALIDRLPPEQLSAAVVVLEAMLDPVSLAIANAPVEEEEITTETAAALERARAFANPRWRHPTRRDPARIRPEKMTEEPAPGRTALLRSPLMLCHLPSCHLSCI